MDLNGEAKTLVCVSIFLFCFGNFKENHGFDLGNRHPGFHFSVFEMDKGIWKYRK